MSDQITTKDPLTSHSVTYGEGHPHAGEEGHSGDMEYVKIAVILAVLTIIEVALSYAGLEGLGLILPLFTVMGIKFALVGMYFMHLRYDNRLLNRIFYIGVFLAVGVYCATLLSLRIFQF